MVFHFYKVFPFILHKKRKRYNLKW